ncbi:MAG: hypothetical protein ACOY82_19165 [Pseudomonadota bacterium]
MTGAKTRHATAPDFAALFRELGVDAACSPAELRAAWRRRVSKLHPDLGGSAEDTGRLQELNRLYDAAVDFHARFGRMPGAPVPGGVDETMSGSAGSAHASAAHAELRDAVWRRADTTSEGTPGARSAAGFGRISRSLFSAWLAVVVSAALLVLGWRIVERAAERAPEGAAPTTEAVPETDTAAGSATGDTSGDATHDDTATTIATSASRHGGASAIAIEPGMGKDTVRNILGEPLEMHALRWQYGPSWVDFDCDRVADWYSSPLRPLPVATERAPQAASAADRGCD